MANVDHFRFWLNALMQNAKHAFFVDFISPLSCRGTENLRTGAKFVFIFKSLAAFFAFRTTANKVRIRGSTRPVEELTRTVEELTRYG